MFEIKQGDRIRIFEDKVKIAKNKKFENVELKKQEKLKRELKNLKDKGILTEDEYQTKLEKIKP